MTGRTIAAAVVLMALAGQALGQNALGNGSEMSNRVLGDRARNGLGDGRGLDTNTLVGSLGRNNQVRDFNAEINFRNAIVTGNAPNGMSFRGDLPYTAPQDFQARMGSNDLYSYRRDSLYSGLAGMGIRGTEALQQQFALQTGNRLPDMISGTLTVNRFGANDPAFGTKLKNSLAPMGLAPSGDPTTVQRTDPSDLQPDFTGLSLGSNQDLGTLRSASAYTSTRSSQPTLLSVRPNPNNDLIGVSASQLRGIQSFSLGKATPDNSVAGLNNTLSGRPSVPNPAGATSTPITSPKPLTEAAVGSNAYQELMSRLTTYAGTTKQTDADTRPDWQRQLDQLRADVNTTELGDTSPDAANAVDSDLPSQGANGAESAFTPTATAPLPPVKNFRFDPATVDTLRNASGQINSLVPLTDASADAYTTHMQIAQSELGKGRYFDAEEAFTRAIVFQPDDPMALIGRIHSQLGAGMNLSAWINLRELFKNHPELLGAKYGPTLLPDADRMADIGKTLRNLIAQAGPLHHEAAMLLAYVGYQTGDNKALEEGIAAMAADSQEQPDGLSDLAAAVWSGKTPAPAPAPAPAEPLPGDPPPLVEPQK